MPRKKAVISSPPDDSQSSKVIENENLKDTDSSTTSDKPPIVKKRGRRPKGGKIITTEKQLNTPVITMQENIILHLRCSLEDIQDNNSGIESMTHLKYNPEIENVQAYSSTNMFGNVGNVYQSNSLNYHELYSEPTNPKEDSIQCEIETQNIDSFIKDTESEGEFQDLENKESKPNEKYMTMINTKLHHLSKELHTDDIRHKKSACFWCTYDFDTEVIHIPKYNMNGRYHVYGCFCSPQCATAHLMSEKVDSSIKFERYQLINNLYAKIYNYTNSIKPAPNPYYVLDKYYGSLSIDEYRDLMNTNRQIVVIDKPMTHVFPELYEDNDDFIVSKRTIPKNNSIYSVRKSKKP